MMMASRRLLAGAFWIGMVVMPSPATAQPPAPEPPSPEVRPLTDADRQSVMADLMGHPTHDQALNAFVLVDQLEWLGTAGGDDFGWDSKGWFGRDRDRLWFRTEGAVDAGTVGDAQAHLLYGRAIGPWWDLVGGIRQDFQPGPVQTWAAIGLQGLAPYWFEVEATAYVGAAGRTHFRFETEYELLVTNRLVLQPLVEVDLYGKADPDHERGAGLASIDGGVRLRYEFRREFAPYVGVEWTRKFFGTADLARSAGSPVSQTRLALGLRLWL